MALRLTLRPVPPFTAQGPRVVTGCVVELEPMGEGTTAATPAAQPAALVFHAILMRGIRKPEAREELALGRLTGELLISSATQRPLFSVAATNPLSLDVPGDEATEPSTAGVPPDPRRIVRLEFSPRTFTGAPADVFLRLPKNTPEFEHLEIAVELEVAGQKEASKAQNDVLDVPLRFPGVRVAPSLCLDTPVEDPGDHNLTLSLELPMGSAPLASDGVAALLLDGKPLAEGPDFFAAPGRVFFRTPAKPAAETEGLLILKDGRAFDFVLRVAATTRERMNSLCAQVENANALIGAAAATSESSSSMRGELGSRVAERKVLLLDSIESTLTSDAELAEFYSRAGSVPAIEMT